MRISKTNETGRFIVLQLEDNILDQDSYTEVLSYYEQNANTWINKILVIDLSKVSFLNSIGINTLIRLLTKTRIAGSDLYLFRTPENLKTILQITKLNSVFYQVNDLDKL